MNTMSITHRTLKYLYHEGYPVSAGDVAADIPDANLDKIYLVLQILTDVDLVEKSHTLRPLYTLTPDGIAFVETSLAAAAPTLR